MKGIYNKLSFTLIINFEFIKHYNNPLQFSGYQRTLLFAPVLFSFQEVQK
jgi:hypothetical protein